jgi:hypothetical protein
LSNFTFFLSFRWTRLRRDFNGLESTRDTRKANTSQNLSLTLENFMDLKDVMDCSCAAPVATSSLWAYLVIANNSLFTGQIVSSMANVKQKMLNRKNLRQKVIANSYYKNSIKNIGNFYHTWDSQVVLVVKNPATNAGWCKRYGFDPWMGRIT